MKSVTLAGPSPRMSSFDAGFLYLERPQAPLSIGCVAVLASELGRDELVRHLEARLGAIPRYAQRAVPAPLALAHPSWEDDPDFDVRNHVHRGALPSPGGDAELCEAVEELLARPLDRTRPLWETHLLEGLHGGRSALVQKVHHCMIDGVAGAGVLEALLDRGPLAPGAARAPAVPRAGRPSGGLARLGGALAASTAGSVRRSLGAVGVLRRPGDLARSLSHVGSWGLRLVLDGPSALPWNGPIGPRRRMAFARLTLDDARVIRTVRGGTVNDVVLCALAGGLRRYLDAIGIELGDRPVTAIVPVSLRTPAECHALGNRVAALLVPLALEPAEETERLAATCAITRRLKEARGFSGVATLLAAADLLPPPLLAWAAGRVRLPAMASLIATNVRGPAELRYLCGRRVEALYPVVPIADGLGLGLAVLSYAGVLYVGLNADADRVPDLEKLRAGVEESFARLRASV